MSIQLTPSFLLWTIAVCTILQMLGDLQETYSRRKTPQSAALWAMEALGYFIARISYVSVSIGFVALCQLLSGGAK